MRRCEHHTSHRVGVVQGSDRAGRVGRFSIARFPACNFPGRWRIHHQEETKVQKYTSGIRKALAYFTYARLFRADGTIISRAGGMRHRDDYSDHVQDVSSNKQYNDILDMAERYLSDALEYLKHFTPEGEVKQQRGTRAHIHVIGN